MSSPANENEQPSGAPERDAAELYGGTLQAGSMLGLRAPGKLFLAGEYAVLEPGRSALLAAVDLTLRLSLRSEAGASAELWHRPSGVSLRGELSGDPRAPITWLGGIPGGLRFAARATELALRLCAEEGLAPRGFHATFENDLTLPLQLTDRMQGKPGLGGSAAASVLAVRAACAAQQRSLRVEETLALAAAAHWLEQGGRGSGGDVAASALGGAIEARVVRTALNAEALASESARSIIDHPLVAGVPIELPNDLRLLAVWSGAPADTRVLLGEVRAFAAACAKLFAARIDQISESERSLRAALGAAARSHAPDSQEAFAGSREAFVDSREAVLRAVREAAAAMAALGEDAKVSIVTPELAEICALASSAGCAGKPSGAGGGDCALVFAFGDASRARAKELLRARGFASAEICVAAAETT